MGILEGKRILVTGVLTDDSLAYGVARLALEQGAEVALTGFGRGLSLTARVARKLPSSVEVYELDATLEELRRHFRKFLKVEDPKGKSLIFRYYDPRVLRVYLPTCNAMELQTVFGPVNGVTQLVVIPNANVLFEPVRFCAVIP